ncbi:hypothetical protein BKA70DRAFT_1217434 [Coprinopsis sp. MPI-PUGE-AT-0042]|nr:hypothetical protein BKA70DRAFT_1217434 [Coprinopsis sp. MPI-PUGE-AT-0042]
MYLMGFKMYKKSSAEFPQKEAAYMEALSNEVLSPTLLDAVLIHRHGENQVELPDQLESFENCRLVCRRWNSIIKTDSAFWTSCKVVIHDDPEAKRSVQITETIHSLQQYFAGSGPRLLSLAIELSLHQEKTTASDSSVTAEDIPIHDVFPNVENLCFKIHSSYEYKLLQIPSQLASLPNLTLLQVTFHALGYGPAISITLAHEILNQVPQLRGFEPILSAIHYVEDQFVDEYIPPSVKTSTLDMAQIRSRYASGSIPVAYLAQISAISVRDLVRALQLEPGHLLELFNLLIFPALETLAVANCSSGVRVFPDHDILPAIQHITGHSKYLATLRLETVHVSDEAMATLLSSLPSFKSPDGTARLSG